MDQLATPESLAQLPTLEEFESPDYDWVRQQRGTIWAGTKQTFDGRGNANDSTSSSGQTQQTFDGRGAPNDSKHDQ